MGGLGGLAIILVATALLVLSSCRGRADEEALDAVRSCLAVF